MRKIAICVSMLCLLSLVSCAGKTDKAALYWLDKAFVAEGVLSDGEGEVSLILTEDAPDDAGARGGAKIEYTAPETISGVAFVMSGGSISASLGDIQIPLADAAGEKIFGICRMFELSEADITDISKSGDKVTITVENEDGVYTVVTDTDGMLLRISASEEESERCFEIESMKIGGANNTENLP